MNPWTIAKAERFVRYKDVELARDSNPPTFLHFFIYSGDYTHEVWRTVHKGGVTWQCNARGKEFGCCLNSCDKTKPFCSHTLAAQILLDKLKQRL